MVRMATVASIGAFFLVCTLLLYFIQQELFQSKHISQNVERLLADAERQHLSKEQWQQVYDVAKASRDTDEFVGHLQRANLVVGVEPVRATGLTPQAPRPGDPSRAVVPTKASVPHPELSRKWAWKHARQNVIHVTWSNFHFVDFVENWGAHLSNHHIQNYLIGAMDAQTAYRLRELGFPYFVMYDQTRAGAGLGADDFGWGSGKFHLMGRHKISLLRTFLSYGLDVMLCDSDTVWLKDPTDYFNRFPAADILTSSDHVLPTQPPGDDGLEAPEAVHSAMNIGVMFFRHSRRTAAFVDEWVAALDADPKVWDQAAFNTLARAGFDAARTHSSNPRLFHGHNGRLVVGILPVAAFASGHTFHVQHLHQVMEVQPYVVHQTFQYGGTKGKRHRLREALLWYDGPSYHDPPGGRFLHAELHYLPAPAAFEALPDAAMSDFHLASMEHQLLQVRELFAVAVASNRTVVMPKLVCYCDRYWGPVSRCRLPGSDKMRLPFICPLDHVFEPFHFDDDPQEFGTPLSFREHSFLENERTPDAVKNGVLTVKLDRDAAPGAVVNEDAFHWRMGANGNDVQLRSTIGASDAPVVRLEFDEQPTARPRKFFQEPFAAARDQVAFVKRITHAPGGWCCRQPDDPHGKGGSPYSSMILGKGIEYRS